MSKLFAKSYMWTKGADKNEIREVLSSPVKVRYLTKTKEFHFVCVDFITLLVSNLKEQEQYSFKVKEEDISRFFKIDSMYEDAKMEEIDYKTLKNLEIGDLEDFYDDMYINLCFVQFYYYLSKDILKGIKRQAHIWKLGRTKTPWCTLTMIPVNRAGGRPVGGGKFGNCYLKREEKDALLDNLARYDEIVSHYAASEVSLDKFTYMHKELAKLGNLLPEWMQKPFMKREEGITWYWHAIRYAYKKQHGLELNPTAEEIKKYQKKYQFPFEE